MTASQRREKIYKQLSAASAPVSAATLAKSFAVTRQIIVGDIALLRAEGFNITATPRGYVIPTAAAGILHRIPCSHSAGQAQDELNVMVDCGCTVLDVIVEHPVYGELTAPLQLSSRFDIEQFMARMAQSDARPLSALTEGVHLHTVSCPSEEALAHMKSLLAEMGILFG